MSHLLSPSRLGLPVAVLAALATGCASTSYTGTGLEVVSLTFDSSNAQLLKMGEAAVLVDSGYERNAEQLAKAVRAAGVEPGQLKAVILTHAHADHAGGARLFQQTYHVPVWVGAGDESQLPLGKNQKLCPTDAIGRLRHDEDEGQTFTGYSADVVVEAPRSLQPLGLDAQVLPVPGHTPGSLIVVAGEVALVGDLLRGSVVGSGAETHFYNCDLEDNTRKVKLVLEQLAPKAQRFFVGHFGPVSRESVAAHFK